MSKPGLDWTKISGRGTNPTPNALMESSNNASPAIPITSLDSESEEEDNQDEEELSPE